MSIAIKALMKNFTTKAKQYSCKNRDFRINQFIDAVIQTQAQFGVIPNVEFITEKFENRLQATNNWGSTKVCKELEAVIADISSATD